MKLTAALLGAYFVVFLILWLACLFKPSVCTSALKSIGIGAAILGFLLLLLKMYLNGATGGYLMVFVLFLLLTQAVLWGICFTKCKNGATDIVKWSGIASAILAIAIAYVAYRRLQAA